LDFIYTCPHCKKQSQFHKHTRFCKYIKSNRAALLKILKLQQEYIGKLNDKMTRIHFIVANVGGDGIPHASTAFTIVGNQFQPLQDINGNDISELEELSL
jgi:hypothetical protein